MEENSSEIRYEPTVQVEGMLLSYENSISRKHNSLLKGKFDEKH